MAYAFLHSTSGIPRVTKSNPKTIFFLGKEFTFVPYAHFFHHNQFFNSYYNEDSPYLLFVRIQISDPNNRYNYQFVSAISLRHCATQIGQELADKWRLEHSPEVDWISSNLEDLEELVLSNLNNPSIQTPDALKGLIQPQGFLE